MRAKDFTSLFCLLLLFSVILSSGIFVLPAEADSTTVSVFPSTVTASLGQNFSIDARIDSVADLYAWELKLSWDPFLLDLVNIVKGPFLDAGGSTYFTYGLNATTGYVTIDCTLLGMVKGVNGSGVLTTITFYVKNAGECPLNLYDVILVNSFEQPISNAAIDGYGYFMYQHDVALTNVTASPLAVPIGEPVGINVTAQNQGANPEVFNVTVYANARNIGIQSISLGSGSSTTVPFTWDITGFAKGDYAISASASVVSGEVDTTDNTGHADDNVTILYPGHDVSVTVVSPLKTLVGQGYSMYVAVTVKNYGIFAETFNTTVYANTTIITMQTTTLSSGKSYNFTFEWNTTGFIRGNYTISAYATPVTNETNTEDNTLIGGTVQVGVPCDVTGLFDGVPDGVTNMRDIGYITSKYGTKPGSSNWDPDADVTGPTRRLPDGSVNMRDIGEACANFGAT